MAVPDDIRDEFIRDCRTLSGPTLAVKYGKSDSTIRTWRLELFRKGQLLWWPGIRVQEDQEYTNHPVIEGDTMVVSDLEVPYHDVVTLGYLVSVAMKFGIKRLVVAGDFLAMDEYSPYPEDEGEFRRTLADSIQAGANTLEDLLLWFDEIHLIKGNHEQRGSRQREVGFIQLAQGVWEDLGDVDLSYYKWCVVISGDREFRVEHPGNYSRVPGSVVRDRAEIEGVTTLTGHTHHWSISFTKNGLDQAVDLGCATDPLKRYYKTANGTTRHPKWNLGFWMIRRGYLYGFTRDHTDWNFWLREVQVRTPVG